MAPAANTARTRRASGSANHANSDSDSDGYQERLKEAEAARLRLRMATEERDKKRKALATAYRRSLSTIQDRIQRSISKYQKLHSAIHMRRLKRLEEAVNIRDGKLEAITTRLVDLQQIMLNHGVQLHALYEGRRTDVTALIPEAQKKSGVDSNKVVQPRSILEEVDEHRVDPIRVVLGSDYLAATRLIRCDRVIWAIRRRSQKSRF
ncbi:hypothetical protein B0H67DRAFT_475750 [Lasiosphaeris hirsuta]|uniref:Uncharacterized protein n=1 Tax=Lasiosphaeris hirsuta TaxID=260670 RepID=A0AA40BBC1_9PEZI|nr:hypothetical protein B0H67DRAFT_475750 [Lasiosphaeris hirsuta]